MKNIDRNRVKTSEAKIKEKQLNSQSNAFGQNTKVLKK